MWKHTHTAPAACWIIHFLVFVSSAVDNEHAIHAVAREVDVSAIRRGSNRAFAAARNGDSLDDGLCLNVDDEHKFRKDLSDEEFAICACHVARRVFTDRPALSRVRFNFVVIQMDNALDRFSGGIHYRDVSWLPVGHEHATAIRQKMLRLVAVWECVDQWGAGLVGSPTNKRGERLVQTDRALELLEGRHKQYVCVATGVLRTGLKAILAEDDPTVGSDIFNVLLQHQDVCFLYVLLPQLALNYPAAFDAVVAKCYVHVNQVLSTGTCYPSVDGGG